MNIGSIFLALLVFGIIIIFHEFGHFIVAKYNRVGVIEFSLGMGPRLISWCRTSEGRKVLFFKNNEFFETHPEFGENTVYSWKILPFGGSCAMLGEEEAVEDDRAFGKKSVYARMAIIFAGPFFNFVLAFLLSLVLIGSVGYDKAAVKVVAENSAMADAGIQENDVITSFNGRKIVLSGELGNYLALYPLDGSAVDLTVDRGGQEIHATVTPRLEESSKGKAYKLGFSYGTRERVGILGTIGYSAYEVKYWIVSVIESLGRMVTGHVSAKDISGPVGIVSGISDSVDMSVAAGRDQAGHVTTESILNAILTLLNFSILLTANLGVMNLIPIPALDGGRLLFLIIEWIRKKPLPEKFENYVNMAGFMMLMALMVLILLNDVLKLF